MPKSAFLVVDRMTTQSLWSHLESRLATIERDLSVGAPRGHLETRAAECRRIVRELRSRGTQGRLEL